MGGSTQEDTKTTTQRLTPEQQGLVSAAVPNYMAFAGSNPTLPGAAGVAPFTAAQRQGQQQVLGSTGQMQDVLGSAAGTNKYLSGGAFLDPGSNPYVQNAVKAATDPIFQDLRENTLPNQQATAAAGPGINYGGSREGIAEGKAIQGAQRAAGQTGAGILNTALGQGLQATGQAVQQAPTTAASLTLPGATTSAVGDVQQQQQQNVLNAQNQASWFQQMLPLLKAQMLTQGAGALPGGSTTAVGSGSSADPISQIIGGASAAGGLAGGLSKLLPLLMV